MYYRLGDKIRCPSGGYPDKIYTLIKDWIGEEGTLRLSLTVEAGRGGNAYIEAITLTRLAYAPGT